MTDPERAMRVVNAIGSGAAFAAVTGVVYSIARSRDIGHKLLLWIVFAACLIRSIANFVGAWEVYFHGNLSWDVWVYFVTAISSCGMSGVVLTSHRDILSTLRTSEAEDRRRFDRAADLQMAEWNLEYLSLLTRNKSLELLQTKYGSSSSLVNHERSHSVRLYAIGRALGSAARWLGFGILAKGRSQSDQARRRLRRAGKDLGCGGQ